MSPLRKHVASLAQLLLDLAWFVLMITGISGAIYQLIIPGGWGEHWIGTLWRAKPTLAIVAIVFAVLALFLGRRWRHSLDLRTHSGNLLMYGWALVGFYFIVQWLVSGSR